MANGYWVGGSGSVSDTAHWSTSSGGAGGASVPGGYTDPAIFDSLSSAVGYTVTQDVSNWAPGGIIFGAPLTGVITLAGSSNIQSADTTTFHSGLINNWTGNLFVGVTSGTATLTMNGVTLLNTLITFGPGTLQLADNVAIAGAGTADDPSLRLNSGTFDANGKTITLTAGSPWVSAGFTGSSALYDLMWDNNTASGVLTFLGAVTMRRLQRTGTNAQSIKPTASTTVTITGNGADTPWPSGTSGNLLTVTSRTAATHTLSFTGTGPISTAYQSISYSTVTQAATAYAGVNSTDGGNNTNWNFTAPPGGTAIKTIMGLAIASVKTVQGLAIASVKTVQGLP